MSKHFQISTRPFWKLGGFMALGLSFVFTAWILGHAIVAAGHLVDLLVAFLKDNAGAWLSTDTNPLT